MKQISFNVQEKIVKERVAQPFMFNYDLKDETVTISVNPILNFTDRKNFVDIIWSMVFVGGEYLPVLFTPAVRVAALYVYTNIKIDLNNIDRTYLLAQYTDIHLALIDELAKCGCGMDYMELEKTAKEYVQFKVQEAVSLQAALLTNSQKSSIDSLVETVLENLNTVLGKFGKDNADISAKNVIDAISKMGQLNDEEKLVENILKFHADEEVSDEHREESAGLPDKNGIRQEGD